MCGAVTGVTEVEQEAQTASRRKPTAGETGPADSSDPAISAISTRAGQTDWTLRVRDNKPRDTSGTDPALFTGKTS